jgi:hypothetical protein
LRSFAIFGPNVGERMLIHEKVYPGII